MAFINLCWGTSCGTSACRAGMLNENTIPTVNEIAIRCQNTTRSRMISSERSSAPSIAADCDTISNVRLFIRSATTPPNGATTSIGIATAALMKPSAEALSVRSNARNPRRMNCICMPMKNARLPKKYQAYSGSLSEVKVEPQRRGSTSARAEKAGICPPGIRPPRIISAGLPLAVSPGAHASLPYIIRCTQIFRQFERSQDYSRGAAER